MPWDSSQGPCAVPEPFVVLPGQLTPATLESHESGLVRVENAIVAAKLGRNPVTNRACLDAGAQSATVPAAGCDFSPDATNCDLNGDGKIDFSAPGPEANCANNCSSKADCSEWSAYASRGNFRARILPDDSIQLNATTVSGFDPVALRGAPVRSFTGTLRNFSGGSLNWTIEARCTDDAVWCRPTDAACAAAPPSPVSSQKACVRDRLIDDPNSN